MDPVSSSYRVLIVDDNEGIHQDFRSLLQPPREPDDLDALADELFGDDEKEETFELPSYRCDSAFQGEMALATVKDAVANGDAYALAFIDIRMPPGWDGVETITHLWAIDPNLQIVLCSAYSDYSWEEIVQKLGVSDKLMLLRKPFDANSVKQITLASTSRWHRDRLVRQQLHQLDERLELCREQLTALERDMARPQGRLRELPVALDELTQLLDGLDATGLASEQAELVAQARAVAARLRSVLAPGDPRR